MKTTKKMIKTEEKEPESYNNLKIGQVINIVNNDSVRPDINTPLSYMIYLGRQKTRPYDLEFITVSDNRLVGKTYKSLEQLNNGGFQIGEVLQYTIPLSDKYLGQLSNKDSNEIVKIIHEMRGKEYDGLSLGEIIHIMSYRGELYEDLGTPLFLIYLKKDESTNPTILRFLVITTIGKVLKMNFTQDDLIDQYFFKRIYRVIQDNPEFLDNFPGLIRPVSEKGEDLIIKTLEEMMNETGEIHQEIPPEQTAGRKKKSSFKKGGAKRYTFRKGGAKHSTFRKHRKSTFRKGGAKH